MIVSDLHNHTTFSHDGMQEIEEAVETAYRTELRYFGISEHFDYDYIFNRVRFQDGKPPFMTDADAYFTKARKIQKAYQGKKTEILVGAEFGFAEDEATFKKYLETYEKYRPDYVINSVHSHYGSEFCDEDFLDANGNLRKKRDIVLEYLTLVKKSLSVPYPYDIVGHISYLCRYLKQEDKSIAYEEYKAEYDEIFKEIIQKDKILEINTASKNLPFDFLPRADVVKGYYDLGGRKISFGSDAHDSFRIGEKRDLVEKALKEIGFEGITVPKNGEHILVKF
ncbi:MAG: histidinol-phosphatase HisJ family protein [Clostridia bacterium]|nr:histidinol-phosphatase HisJ family protein [Clostridia bacterium]